MVNIIITSSPYMIAGQNKTLKASVLNDDGTPVMRGQVQFVFASFYIHDINSGESLFNIQDGVASCIFEVPLEYYEAYNENPNLSTLYAEDTRGNVSNTQKIEIRSPLEETPASYNSDYSDNTPVILEAKDGNINLILTEQLPAGTYNITGHFLGTATHAEATGNATLTIQDPSTQESTNYGLGTDNPWTADNTLNPVWHSGLVGALATNFTKQSTGTTVNIPLTGDFEITFNLNITGNAGTGWFALYDGNTNIVEVNMDNTLNGNTINTVFPNPDTGYNMNTETYTLKREGTTYTYKHGNETRTLTINNTNPVYLKMRKTGNADMYLTNMSIQEIRGGA